MLRLMHPSPALPKDHSLLSYQYCEGDCWSQAETEAFHRALLKHNKDFYQVAKEVYTISYALLNKLIFNRFFFYLVFLIFRFKQNHKTMCPVLLPLEKNMF